MNGAQPLFDYINSNLQDFQNLLISICEVPAPTFAEKERARHFAALLQNQGLSPDIDEVGNVRVVIASRGGPHLVLSAHLDTVFPFTEIRVEKNGHVLKAPGISDDSSGLAALIFLSRALQATGLPERGSLTLLATVGEEGLGNLRGVKHFFDHLTRDVDYFISLDGSDAERIVTTGLASKRLRITLRGPGGHSWGDAGVANPIHYAGELLHEINQLSLPTEPKTTLNVGVITGGTTVNTIPREVTLDADLRSEGSESLLWLSSFIDSTVEMITRRQNALRAEIQIIGERPAGAIDPRHPMVRAAVAANRQFGLQAKLDTGSTDANIPFALGIPSLTMGVGGRSGKIHTPEEWYDPTGVENGLKRTALLLTQLLNHDEKM